MAVLRFVLLFVLIRIANSSTTSVNVLQGETLILKCPGQPVVLWGDTNDNVFANGIRVNGNLALSNRLAVTKEHHLVIKNFSNSDPRIVVCETNEPKRFSFEVKMMLVTSTCLVNITKGETLILKCPEKPVILWGDKNDNVFANGATVKENLALSNRLAVTKEHHLVINNFSNSDPRIYVCETSETKRHAFKVKLMQKPFLVGTNIDRFLASILEPTYISFNVSSDTQPDVSWVETSGGKLGYWKIYDYEEREIIHDIYTIIYNVTSTILPSDKSHIGRYVCLVRNSVGSIDIYIDLVEDKLSVFPASAVCNISSHVTFTCNMTKVKNGKQPVFSSWTHLYNGQQIRNFSSIVVEMVAFLTIPHCDYRDTGIYMCEWINGRHIYSAFSSLTVNSSPIYISQRKTLILGRLALELFLYSVPKPDKVVWLYNDRPIDYLQLTSRYLKETRVKLNFYNTDLETDGYIAVVVVNYSHYLDSRLYTCQVRNDFGTMEARFKDTAIIDNATTVGYESEPNPNWNFVIYGAVLFVTFLTAGTIAGTIVMHRKKASDTAEEKEQEVQAGIPVRNSVESSENPSYEEIDDVSYQSVTWRNYNTETDSSEGEADVQGTYVNEDIPSGYLQCNQDVGDSHKYEIYGIEINSSNH